MTTTQKQSSKFNKNEVLIGLMMVVYLAFIFFGFHYVAKICG